MDFMSIKIFTTLMGLIAASWINAADENNFTVKINQEYYCPLALLSYEWSFSAKQPPPSGKCFKLRWQLMDNEHGGKQIAYYEKCCFPDSNTARFFLFLVPDFRDKSAQIRLDISLEGGGFNVISDLPKAEYQILDTSICFISSAILKPLPGQRELIAEIRPTNRQQSHFAGDNRSDKSLNVQFKPSKLNYDLFLTIDTVDISPEFQKEFTQRLEVIKYAAAHQRQ